MAGNPRRFPIADPLIRRLQADVAERRVSRGIALLESAADLFESLDPLQRNAAPLVSYLGQWIDIGYREPELLQSLLARFPKEIRGRLPLRDYLHLRMAEGLLALLHDDADEALAHFRLVLGMQEEIADKDLIAI